LSPSLGGGGGGVWITGVRISGLNGCGDDPRIGGEEMGLPVGLASGVAQ